MRVVCFTESLGNGGAERQLCSIAVGLKREGWDVVFVTYAQGEFYSHVLQKEGVERIALRGTTRWQRFKEVRKYLCSGRQDAVLAFLAGPSVWALLSGIPHRKWALVVSERSAVPKPDRQKWRAYLYSLADYITTNSHSNRLILEDLNPSLRGRIITIYNGVDLAHFRPASPRYGRERQAVVNLVSVGTLVGGKNIAKLIEAMAMVRERRPELHVEAHWYGSVPEDDQSAYRAALQSIEHYGMHSCVHIHEATRAIADVYQKSDALIHPSFYEGLPNAVCEGMACGLPILMSNVSDAGNLVVSERNGFLFDPSDAEDMAKAIVRFCELPQETKQAMGVQSRTMAESLFDKGTVTTKYKEVLEKAVERTAPPIVHWPEAVPNTAREFLKH
jgi:glycosyltransferase involved in cell wall biosynthesis